MPPLSPTSMSPFFSNPATKSENVTEIFNECAPLTPCDETSSLEIDKLLTLRRHTVGPGPKPDYAGPALQPNPDLLGILPQTNLMQNLALVSNLPPESFSVKDPHLLKPPLALLGITPNGRRASDGGRYNTPEDQHTQPYDFEIQLSPGIFVQPDMWNGPAIPPDFPSIPNSPCQLEPSSFDTRSEGGGASRAESPNHHMVEEYLKSRGQTKCHTIPESPRKRRTGLHTVMEKPPTINPDLVEEVETRIKIQSPNSLTHSSTHMPMYVMAKQKPVATGLTPVLEVGNLAEIQARDSLQQRYSPVRRSRELSNRHYLLSSGEPFPSLPDAKITKEGNLQMEENKSSVSSESGSSGYMSSQFYLRPPSPGDHLICDDATQIRRSSDSGVQTISICNKSSEVKIKDPCLNTQEAISRPIQQLYQEMYNTELQTAIPNATGSRRYSYPNSPVHIGVDKSSQQSGLSEHLQHLKLQKKTEGALNLMALSENTTTDHWNVTCETQSNNSWKGSITQGVPSRSPTNFTVKHKPPTEIETHSLFTPTIITHSRSYDETLATHHPFFPQTLCNKHHSGSVYSTSNELSFSHLGTSTGDNCLRPGICLTNITGDEILLYRSFEPMDQSN